MYCITFKSNFLDYFLELIMFSILSPIITNIIVYPLPFIVSIDKNKFRILYIYIQNNLGLKLLNEWDSLITSKQSKIKISEIIFYLIQILIYIVSFHFCFGFCSVYYDQQLVLIVFVLSGLLSDVFILEILTEILMTILYTLRKKNNFFLSLFIVFDELKRTKCFL